MVPRSAVRAANSLGVDICRPPTTAWSLQASGDECISARTTPATSTPMTILPMVRFGFCATARAGTAGGGGDGRVGAVPAMADSERAGGDPAMADNEPRAG